MLYFQEFAEFASCAGKGLTFLRAASDTVLNASTALNSATTDGAFRTLQNPDGI